MSEWRKRVEEFRDLNKEVSDKALETMKGELTLDQALRLQQLLEKHAANAAQLLQSLEEADEEPTLIAAAKALDAIAVQLVSLGAQVLMAKRDAE